METLQNKTDNPIEPKYFYCFVIYQSLFGVKILFQFKADHQLNLFNKNVVGINIFRLKFIQFWDALTIT